jgi:hypothetical protein
MGAVIVGPFQAKRPEHALKRFFVTSPILGAFSASASQFPPCVIGRIGVQPLFQRVCRQPQRLSPHRHLDGFEIQTG